MHSVKKIKGPKGTEVRLTVKKADGTIKVITLIRDEIEIEETYLKSSIVEKNGLKYGVIYLPKFYIDFEANEWKQVSTNPVIFETIVDGVSLEIYDTSQNSYKLKFRKGGRMQLFRVVGKFRLTWDDKDLILETKQ